MFRWALPIAKNLMARIVHSSISSTTNFSSISNASALNDGSIIDPASLEEDRLKCETTSFPQDADDSLENKRWMKLVEECVNVFDELDGLFPMSDPRHETAEHVMYRLREILSRSGVEIISRDRTFDSNRHVSEPPNMEILPGTPITEIISPGFAVGRRVLRPARVRVAHSISPTIEQTE